MLPFWQQEVFQRYILLHWQQERLAEIYDEKERHLATVSLAQTERVKLP